MVVPSIVIEKFGRGESLGMKDNEISFGHAKFKMSTGPPSSKYLIGHALSS